MTCQQVGDCLNITGERVSQIEIKAFRLIKLKLTEYDETLYSDKEKSYATSIKSLNVPWSRRKSNIRKRMQKLALHQEHQLEEIPDEE